MSNYPDSYPVPPQYDSPPPRSRLSPVVWLLLITVALWVLPQVTESVQFAIARAKQRAAAEVARQELGELPTRTSIYRMVAKAIAPSVVGVNVEMVEESGPADEWSYFFPRRPLLRKSAAEGSGVIIDASGYVLTNAHVVDNATHVSVRLSDGRRFDDVRVVGADPLTDIAVLKMDAGNLTAAVWGDASKLEVGDEVLAVGSPYGLDSTVTAGIVSAKSRREVFDDSRVYQDFLQTDAAVNPGNSGGPLVNLKGEVVGINTAIVGRSYHGISFAIPSQIARNSFEQLKTAGKVVRGWLGVELQAVDARLAARLNLPKDVDGVLIAGVVRNAPAQQAGLEIGDLIVAWGDRPIQQPSDLTFAVAQTPVGSKVKVKILRGKQQMEIEVTVGERPERVR